MTTIISNGYYMIGDKRSTHTGSVYSPPQLGSDYEKFTPSRPRHKGYQDGTTKLIPLPKTTFSGKKIMVIGGAGNVDAINEALSYLSYMTVDDLIKVRAAYAGKSDIFQLLLITEDHCTHKLSFSPRGANAVAERTYKPGVVVGIGSGGILIAELNERFNDVLNNAHVLDTFLLAANTDSASSNFFDVYGVRENAYFQNIRPSPEEVSFRARRAGSLLDFGIQQKQHRAGRNQ